DIDQDETLHFLVMEYVDGASLQEIIKRSGPLNPVRAAHYISQAAIGLAHAHKEGLVHRDIKPGNILVDRNGVVKILDMGLARFFYDEEDMLTKKYDENVLGTADYLAPEQALDSHSVDIRADIYSLGATFYFILTDRTPFGEGTTAQKLIWHQTRQPKPLTQVRKDVPAGLVAIIEKMMAKDPSQRYQTPSAVAEALTPWTGGTIDLPTEQEMPRLSLAATGGSPPSETTPVPPVSVVPPSGARKTWQLPSAQPPKPPSPTNVPRPPKPPGSTPPPDPKARTAAPAVQVQTPATRAAPQASRVPRPTPTEDEESIPWERGLSDTEDPSAKVDTAAQPEAKPQPAPRRSAAKPRPALKEGGRSWFMLILVILLLLGTFVLAGFGFGLFDKLFPRHDANTPRTLKVTSQGGPYRTVQHALKDAKANDRILLMDAEHRERLRVEKGQIGTNRVEAVSIEAAAGVDVVWKAPADKRDAEPLLWLDGVKGLKVKGIRFHGENRQGKLIQLTGSCPGLTLEGITLEGFKQTGLLVFGCMGEPSQPVQLVGIKDRPQPKGGKGEVAILFEGNNEHFDVRNCRFTGSYTKQAILLNLRGPNMKFTDTQPPVP
ncbi:MAG TPA: protein kinase, partial [Gemmataceae bacterium]|nr:protein kinase [Gemmataceae bacterium]